MREGAKLDASLLGSIREIQPLLIGSFRIDNDNATLVSSQITVVIIWVVGNFEWKLGFCKAGTVDINATIEVTGKAGNVLDLSDGILGVKTSSSDQVFENTKGSQNLITYQGDLNYDGRVSFRDLAYLNAGASRQELTDKLDSDGQVVMEDGKAVKVATDETYASDVDANYDGKISMSDLTTLLMTGVRHFIPAMKHS